MSQDDRVKELLDEIAKTPAGKNLIESTKDLNLKVAFNNVYPNMMSYDPAMQTISLNPDLTKAEAISHTKFALREAQLQKRLKAKPLHHPQNNLPDMRATVEVIVGGLRFGEGENLVDDRGDSLFAEKFQQGVLPVEQGPDILF
jgi:hypothetical protein